MIRSAIVITALALCACVSDPKAHPDAAHSSVQGAHVDMSLLVGKEVDGLTFLQHCQAQSGRNYTYDAATAKALENCHILWSNQPRVPIEQFDVSFGHVLSASGFDVSPVGPPELRVLLIRRK
ncbi:MAG: hypothetical protein JNL28_12625 [Planctomycetes bacterium]|nr:hypothetical protein [Planctomycetota bacterium]